MQGARLGPTIPGLSLIPAPQSQDLEVSRKASPLPPALNHLCALSSLGVSYDLYLALPYLALH